MKNGTNKMDFMDPLLYSIARMFRAIKDNKKQNPNCCFGCFNLCVWTFSFETIKMLWKKRDRPFFETMYMKYIIKNCFNRNLIKTMENIVWIPIKWKLKRKFKSIVHYIINWQVENSQYEAWLCLKQFMDRCEEKAKELWIENLHEFNLEC